MKTLLLLLMLIFAGVSFAQPQLEWYAVNDSLSPVDIGVDSDGNVIIGGVGFRIAKYDANGVLKWYKGYIIPQGCYDHNTRKLAVDNNGNAIITGMIECGFTGKDYCTIKYWSYGSLAWVRTYSNLPGHHYDEAYDVVTDGTGSVFVTGYSHGDTQYENDLCTISYSSYGDTSWIIRTDLGQYPYLTTEDEGVAITLNSYNNPVVVGRSSSSGYTINHRDVLIHSYGATGWSRTYGDTLHREEGVDIAVDDNNNIFVAAKSSKNFSSLFRDADFICLKYKPNGVFQWARYYNGSSDSMDVPVEIITDHNGNVYITGYSYNDSTNFDWCTIKYNSNGDEQWIKIYNRLSSHHLEKPVGIKVDNNNNIYVCGTSYSHYTGVDVTIVKYDTSGNEVWVEHFSRPGYTQEIAISFCMDESGNMYFTSRNENWSAVTGKYSQSVGINKLGSTLPIEFCLSQNYPNPFNPTTNIRFDISKSGITVLKVYDILGKEVATLVNKKLQAGSYEVDWNASNFSSGVYFYQLQSGDFVKTKKMLFVK